MMNCMNYLNFTILSLVATKENEVRGKEIGKTMARKRDEAPWKMK
jgi:hypothetical protein